MNAEDDSKVAPSLVTVEQLQTELAEIKTVFGHFACRVMAIAITGYADAAIVSNQPIHGGHALAAVVHLARLHRELRSSDELLGKLAAEKGLGDEKYAEYPCDYQDTFDAGIEQGRINLAREILALRLERKNEEARRVHRDQERDAAQPEAGTGGVPPVPEG